MCLYVDDFDTELIDSGQRKARKEHRCDECGRTIEPGETYRYWTTLFEGDISTDKMCAHCQGTLDLGAALTGCPKRWWWSMLHDLDPETGFVGNVLHDDEHHLTQAQKRRMLRTVEGRKAKWRRRDGRLRPVPAPKPGDPHYVEAGAS